jgi:hypothetical protein
VNKVATRLMPWLLRSPRLAKVREYAPPDV